MFDATWSESGWGTTGVTRLHRPKAGFWIRLSVLAIYPFVGLLFRVRLHHLDRVPPPSEGGVVLAVNHVSQIDTMLIARFVWQSGRIPRFMIKSTLFESPVLGWVLRGAGQISVQRYTRDAALALSDAVDALARGEAVIIYPEGTTTKDPTKWPMQGKTGIARLVLLSPDTPVIPVGQWGAQHDQGWAWRRLGRRRVADVSVGRPLDLAQFRGLEPNAANLRTITDVIMSAIRDEVAQLRGGTAPETFFVPSRKSVDPDAPPGPGLP
jgi:1-acyl-sn-glycerol-3-phosphate acyltransferase